MVRPVTSCGITAACVFFLVLCSPLMPGAAGAAVVVDDGFRQQSLGRVLSYVEDPGGQMTIHEVRALPPDRFTQSSDEALGFGNTTSVYWLRLALDNRGARPHDTYLDIDNPLLDRVECYHAENPSASPKISGDSIRFRDRDVQYRSVVFELLLPTGPSTWLVRVQTASNMSLPATLWDGRAFRAAKQAELAILWVYYGVMAAMAFFGLLIFAWSRDRNYLYFTLAIAAFALFRMSYNGLSFQYLWPDHPALANTVIPFSVALFVGLLVQFTRSFLELKVRSRAVDRFFQGLLVLFFLGMVYSLAGDYRNAIRLVLGASLVTAFFLIAAGFLALARGSREARFYLVSWGVFLLGSILNILRDFGLAPVTFLTSWGQQVGSALQVLLLALGLVDRINTMKNEVTTAHRELQRINEALGDERELLSVTLRGIGDAVITTDRSRGIRLMNHAAEGITGWRFEEAAGRPVEEVLRLQCSDGPGAWCDDFIERTIASNLPVEPEVHARILARDGRSVAVSCSCVPIHDRTSAVVGAVVVFRDITEKLRIEQEMLKTSRLESLATFAGGIAHDFNNILTVITGNLALMRVDTDPATPLGEMVADTEKITFRAKDLTRQLLTFAKGGVPLKKITDIKVILRETASFIASGSRVKIDFNIPEDLWAVEIDEGQFSQAINNLVINAIQAMPRGGRITLTAANCRRDEGAAHPGVFVEITVRDEGVGIPPENLGRIFDPFFTTKPEGSGLGLASTYSIVTRHDGYITVESAPGAGTTFHVGIPSCGTPIRPEPASHELLVYGSGRILIMDDEEMVLRTAGRLATSLGYEVVAVTDGSEVIEEYRRAMAAGGPYAAVIMDLTVPGGMGGRAAIEHLRALDPSVKAVVSSGYSNDPVMSDFASYGFIDIVVKPYTLEQLAQVLARVTRQPSSGEQDRRR